MSLIVDPSNSGFETAGDWTLAAGSGGFVERISSQARSGSWSLSIRPGNQNIQVTAALTETAGTVFGPASDGRVRVSFWVKPTNEMSPSSDTPTVLGVPAPRVLVTSRAVDGTFHTQSEMMQLGQIPLGQWTYLERTFRLAVDVDELTNVRVATVSNAGNWRFGLAIDDVAVDLLPGSTSLIPVEVTSSATAEAVTPQTFEVDAAADIVVTGEAATEREVSPAAGLVEVTASSVLGLVGAGVVTGTQRPLPTPIVEVAAGQPWSTPLAELVWTQVPNCVRSMRKREGRSHRLDAVEPGTMRIVFDNRDSALDPSNIESPLWATNRPGVDYGTWMRVSLDLGDEGGVVPWFVGTVDRIHLEWDLGDAIAEIDLVDALAILAQRRLAPSVLREVVAAAGAVHHWPLSEPGGVIQDVIGERDGSWNQALTVGEGLLPHSSARSASIPQTENDNVTGSIPNVNLSGSWTLGVVAQLDGIDREASEQAGFQLLEVSGPTPFRIWGGWNAFFNPAWIVGYQVTSGVQSFTNLKGSPVVILVSRDAAAGVTRWVRARPSEPNGWPNTINVIGDTDASATITIRPTYSPPAGWVADVQGASTRIQDIFVLPGARTQAELLQVASSAFAPWATDTTAERFERMCELAGLPAVVAGTGFPTCSPAVTTDRNALAHSVECANGDGSTISIDLSTGAPLYRQTDPDDVVMWWDTTGRLGAPIMDLEPRYGIDRLAVAAVVHRGTGEAHTAVDPSSPYPPSATVEVDTALGAPTDARNRAAEIVADRRKPRWVIDKLHTQGRDARVPAAGLLLRPGDHVGVLAYPPGRSTLMQVASVERLDHHLDYRAWSWDIEYGVDRVTMFITYDELLDRHATYDELPVNYPTWFDLLSSGEPNPPEGA